MGVRPMCRHCGREAVTRPRGLGWKCYYTPGVRDLYGATGERAKYARRGVRNFSGPAPIPPGPTDAMPGTAAKLAVLESRAAAGYELHHPGDARG